MRLLYRFFEIQFDFLRVKQKKEKKLGVACRPGLDVGERGGVNVEVVVLVNPLP